MWNVNPVDSSGEVSAVSTAGPVLAHTLKEKGHNEIIDCDWSVRTISCVDG